MPDARLQRTRETLPEGYQFGDGRPEALSPVGATFFLDGVHYVVGERAIWVSAPELSWRAPHENDAEQLHRRAYQTDCDPGDESV